MAKVFKDIWDKTKDGSKKQERGFIRYVIYSTAVFVLLLFATRDSVIRWVQTAFEIRSQKREIEYYQQKIESLDRQIEALSTNRDTLETFARETFLFAEPGDDVYILEK